MRVEDLINKFKSEAKFETMPTKKKTGVYDTTKTVSERPALLFSATQSINQGQGGSTKPTNLCASGLLDSSAASPLMPHSARISQAPEQLEITLDALIFNEPAPPLPPVDRSVRQKSSVRSDFKSCLDQQEFQTPRVLPASP